MTCGQVWLPILGMCALHLTHSKCTHTAVKTHTHTVNTHLELWAAIYAAAPGEQLGFRCLAWGHLSRGIEGGREHCTFPHPTYNSCWTRDSNSQPLGYESDSIIIRSRFPLVFCSFLYQPLEQMSVNIDGTCPLSWFPWCLFLSLCLSLTSLFLLYISGFV